MASTGDNEEVAERGGFEPPVTTRATPVFKTGPFNRSGTSPRTLTLIGTHRLRQSPETGERAFDYKKPVSAGTNRTGKRGAYEQSRVRLSI